MNATFLSLATLAAAFAADPPEATLHRYEQSQRQMGVEIEIVLYAPSEIAAQQAFSAAFARIAALNQVLSDYEPTSELSRLSEAAPLAAPRKVSDDLWAILARAEHWNRQSDGAFDITVGPLTKLWRRARRNKELPSDEQLQAARQAVGSQHLRLDPRRQTAQLLTAKMRLDAGGIAKGFAADEALATLKQRGLSRALVRASGDIAAGDPPPGESGWLVGLAPLAPDDPPQHFIRLANAAVSTSGDSRQHLEIDGRRYSHIIDPRTGVGISGHSSVTVIAPRGIDADALASAISILGPEKGLLLVEATHGAAAFLIVGNDAGKPREFRSQRFNRFEAKP